MTEPDVASSDATNISCSLRKEGSNYIVSGKKWWISGIYFISITLVAHCI